jgi:hypothetical protein
LGNGGGSKLLSTPFRLVMDAMSEVNWSICIVNWFIWSTVPSEEEILLFIPWKCSNRPSDIVFVKLFARLVL